jgi:hypothetical protein
MTRYPIMLESAAARADRKSRRLAFALCLLLQVSACKQSSKPQTAAPADVARALINRYPEGPRLGQGSARIAYSDRARLLEKEQGLSGLIAESSDGHGLLFKAATPGIASLREGDILVIKSVAARKVLGVERKGDRILVVAVPATIRETVAEGEIHLQTPIKFGNTTKAALAPPRFTPSLLDIFATPAYADSFSPGNIAASAASANAAAGATLDGFKNMVTSVAGFVVGDWTISNWSATPAGDRLNVNLTMKKELAGFKALVTMTGYIANFDLIQNMQIGKQFGTTQLEAAVKTLAGQMQFRWQIGKDSPGGFAKEDRIRLPAAVTIPLEQYVAGLPLTLDISSALIVHPAITGGKQFAAGGFTVTYNGSMIDTVNNDGSSQASGDLAETATLDQDQGISAVAPIGMVIAYCVPRFELSLGLGKIFNFPENNVKAADAYIASFLQEHPAVQKALSNSPVGTAVISNTLASNADIFAQLIATGGSTESGSSVLVPCSNVTVEVKGQIGINGNLFGKDLVGGGSTPVEHTKDVFAKSWNRNTGGVCAGIQ